MKCQQCGKEFPTRKGRFCGTCFKPTPYVKIDKKVLFRLMHSHSMLAQAEYHRNPAYNDSHFSAVAETGIAQQLNAEIVNEYFNFVDSEVGK
jgi:predicted amidophosphoribosyltransferase